MAHPARPRGDLCIVAVAAASMLVCGCETDAPAKRSDPSAAFGVDILTVRDCQPPKYEELAPDERLVGVEVEVRANRKGVPANFYYGNLSDARGNTYRPTFFGCTPRLTAPPLAAGGVKRGFVNFKLPASAADLTFIYAPRLERSSPEPASSVALPLGR